jgi:maltooligosyltrehalose trehalohydrolase
VHAIGDRDWLIEMADLVRAAFPHRLVHLVVENENNDAGLLEAGFDAQWNDDFHNVMHVLLTGETHAYYADFAHRPAARLARCLAEGFIYQGEGSPNHAGRPRGQKSSHLPPDRFVAFLQNHDQVGNRAMGERLSRLARPHALRAAMALLLLCPQIPLLFMGEEAGAEDPFLFFTDFHGELADAVRQGRRREFASHPSFDSEDARASIPDPNAVESFAKSQWKSGPDAAIWRALIGELLGLRRKWIVPYLRGAGSIAADAVGEAAVVAAWRLANGAILTLAANFGQTDINTKLPAAAPFFGAAAARGILPAETTLAWIEVTT